MNQNQRPLFLLAVTLILACTDSAGPSLDAALKTGGGGQTAIALKSGGQSGQGGALATGGRVSSGGSMGTAGSQGAGGSGGAAMDANQKDGIALLDARDGLAVDSPSGSGGASGLGGAVQTGGSGGKTDAGLDATGMGGTGGIGPTGMRNITSMALVKDMGFGTNLGNTLDAVGGETAWGNPMTTQAMIQAVAKAGFKSMRIPVSWRGNFGPAPTYTITTTWMNRVKQIVDWVMAEKMYAIINLHHDGGGDFDKGAWIRNPANDPNQVMAQFKALWTQIAGRFKDYSDYLVFESMNEVGFEKEGTAVTQADYVRLNEMNRAFVTLVRASGGNNGQRHLLIAGYWTDIEKTIKGVVMPKDDRAILSVHYYTPWQFCINGDPRTWGSAQEISALKNDFAKLKAAYIDKGIPVILGEYGVNSKAETQSRIYWMEYVAKSTCDLGIAPYLWDAGGTDGEFNRSSLSWRNPGLLDAYKRACSGQNYTIVKP